MQRTLLVLIFAASVFTVSADIVRHPAERVIQRDADSSMNEVVRPLVGPGGRLILITNVYTTLATGMNVRQPDGSFLPADTAISPQADGTAAALQTRHKIYFKPDITDANGPIHFVGPSPDNTEFVARPLCISYYDRATGSSVLIGEFQSSIGTIAPGASKVVYRNCCADFKCNLIVENTLAGMESWLEIVEAPPSPAEFGLNNGSTQLELITEFLSAPPVIKSTVTKNGVTDDVTLSAGPFRMPPGIAFKLGDGKTIHVRKQWTMMDGRKCLIENVDFDRAKATLQRLPRHASVPSDKRAKHIASSKRELPAATAATFQSSAKFQIAKASHPMTGFVFDYSILGTGSLTDYKFMGGRTYFVTNAVTISGTTVIEGGAVIKYSTNALAKLSIDALDCRTGSYLPAVFTSMMDDSVGETIAGSTSDPSASYCGDVAIESSTPENCPFHDFRFCYLTGCFAIPFSKADGGAGSITGSNFQVVHCQSAFITSDSTFSLKNGLFVDIGTLFGLPTDGDFAGQNYYGENLTIHRCGNFAVDYSGGYYLTNCLLVQTTNFQVAFSYQWHTNKIVQLSNDSGVFASVGGGNHYLADVSPYRGAGTTNGIDADLLSSLRQKTTYAPLLLTTAITTNTTLGIQAPRDSYGPGVDIGYHYDPIDYAMGELSISGATVSITNGATIALYVPADPDYASSFSLSSSAIFSQGTPTQPNRIVWYNTVQESTNADWDPPGRADACIFGNADSNCTLDFRFTHASFLDGQPTIFGDPNADWEARQLTARDCEFHNGNNSFFAQNYSGHAVILSFTNCLFDRCGITCYGMSQQKGPMAFENCLFYSNQIFLTRILSQPYPITFTNCLFDTSNITETNSVWVDAGYNAYLTNNTHRLTPTNANDVILPLSVFPYATGALGDFYQNTNNLINVGYTTADQFALYHFTVLTNQVKETNSVTDIGYHYVAVNLNGNPDDSDGDGVPDYLEDANGNGGVDSGETDWQSTTDLGLKVQITQPTSISNLP